MKIFILSTVVIPLTALVLGMGCASSVLRKADKPHDLKNVMACGAVIDGSKAMRMCDDPPADLFDVSKPE